MHGPTVCCLQETPFKDIDRLKLKGQKKIFHSNSNENRARVPTLISDKIELK